MWDRVLGVCFEVSPVWGLLRGQGLPFSSHQNCKYSLPEFTSDWTHIWFLFFLKRLISLTPPCIFECSFFTYIILHANGVGREILKNKSHGRCLQEAYEAVLLVKKQWGPTSPNYTRSFLTWRTVVYSTIVCGERRQTGSAAFAIKVG